MRLSVTTWPVLYVSSIWVASCRDATAFVPLTSYSQNYCTDDFDNTVLMQTTLAFTRENGLETNLKPNHEHDHANTERAELHREESFGKHADSKSIMETTVQSMSATLGVLEHKIRQDPSGSWDEQATILSSLRTMIVNELQMFLDNEHEQDQAEFTSRRQQHGGCSGDQRWESGGDVANAAAELAISRAKHQACRSSERAWLTYKTTAISPPSCASESEISTSHHVLAAHVTLAALVGAAQTRAQAYDLTEPAGTRECPLDQTQFEDHFCTWRAAHFYACAASQDCIALTGLTALRDELLMRSDNRRNLWRTLEIMLCRVEHLLSSMDGDTATEVSDFNTTDNCSDILEDPTKFILDLTIPSPPVCNDHIAVGSATSILVAPSMVDAAMCTRFREANYGSVHGWDQAQHVIPSECETTCPAISYSTWVVPAACINEPEDCRFYNHHRDACGLYDTASFVARDTCCACGGGAITGLLSGYTHLAGACVGGHNIRRYANKTPLECAVLCEAEASCVSFEIGVDHGGTAGPVRANECQLQNGAGFAGCNGWQWNRDLYVKPTHYLTVVSWPGHVWGLWDNDAKGAIEKCSPRETTTDADGTGIRFTSCCTMQGVGMPRDCGTTRNTNFETAVEQCAAQGGRLCTADEASSPDGTGRNTVSWRGCSLDGPRSATGGDSNRLWTSTPCSP